MPLAILPPFQFVSRWDDVAFRNTNQLLLQKQVEDSVALGRVKRVSVFRRLWFLQRKPRTYQRLLVPFGPFGYVGFAFALFGYVVRIFREVHVTFSIPLP